MARAHASRTAGVIGMVAPVAALARLILPFTPRGLLLSLLAAGLLAAGILRADLAALFWGSSFLLFSAYALLGGHILRAAVLARHARDSDMVSVVLSPDGVFPGEESEARIDARLPRAFPPGFSVRVRLPLSWHRRRLDAVGARLPAGASSHIVRFPAPWRGAYASAAVTLECRDILGFTSGRVTLSLRETLIVYPALREPHAAARRMEQADEPSADSRRRRRSEELLEARKYYPGDDVRRLNWKVFAHLDELFVRMGEEVPPPEARLLFVLDTTTNPLVPSESSADYLDGLVSACVSAVDSLRDERREVLLSEPGSRECRSFGSRSALLAHAADCSWTDAPWAPDLPSRPMHVAVFSSPGSPGLARILAAIRSRGWSASLFLKGRDPSPPAARRRVADFLLVPRGGAPGTGRSARAAARRARRGDEALAEAAARDIASWRGEKVRNAVEV